MYLAPFKLYLIFNLKTEDMRKIIFLLLTIAISLSISAQAYEDKIEYNKVKQPALAIVYKFPPEAVEDALILKLAKLGYKGKVEKGIFNKDKGFHIFKGALLGDISTSRYDYLINIDEKNHKTTDEAILYMIIMKKDTNYLAKLSYEELTKAKTFLDNLLPDIEDSNLELKIIAAEGLVIQSDKKMKKLVSEREDIEEKIKTLQDNLVENEKKQEKEKMELENQRKAFEELKSKRRKKS